VVELTGLERMVVLNSHVLRRTLLLLTNKQLQLQPLTRLHLLLMKLQVRLPGCRHLQIFGILQLNMQVELQVRTITLLRAVQTSVKKITELVNKDLFSNQNVTLSMQRQKPNSGRRSERRLTLQSAVAECLMLKNF
jgi:hypothetical protein